MQVLNLSVTQLKDVIVDVLRGMNVATKDDLKNFATKDDLESIKNDTNGIKETIKTLATKKDLQKINKKFDRFFNFLDKDYIRVKKDVRDIQSHLHIPVSDF